jgi:hypothetical protein
MPTSLPLPPATQPSSTRCHLPFTGVGNVAGRRSHHWSRTILCSLPWVQTSDEPSNAFVCGLLDVLLTLRACMRWLVALNMLTITGLAFCNGLPTNAACGVVGVYRAVVPRFGTRTGRHSGLPVRHRRGKTDRRAAVGWTGCL